MLVGARRRPAASGDRLRLIFVGFAVTAVLAVQIPVATVATVASTAASTTPWWSSTESLSSARVGHSATVLDGPACRAPSPPAYCGKALVVGGEDSDDSLASAEMYDAGAAEWVPVASLITPRAGHSATLLDPPPCHGASRPPGYEEYPCGQVLVVGGKGADGTALGTAELYDPGNNSWSEAGTLEAARSGHTATLLADGEVLVVSGSSAELWGPAAAVVPRHLLSIDAAVQVTERNTTPETAYFNVRLSSPSPRTVTVDYQTADGTARSPAPASATACAGTPSTPVELDNSPGQCDYVPTSGSLTFLPGDTEKAIRVPVPGDRYAEPEETFFMRLSGAKEAVLARAEGRATIVDDDVRFASASDTRTVEGGSEQSTADFVISLSQPAISTTKVGYQTADDTALAGSDYVSRSGTVTFERGESIKTVEVEILDDVEPDEGDEKLLLKLAGTAGVQIADSEAVGTIVDDDPVAVRVDDAVVAEDDGPASFRVWLSHAPGDGKKVTVKVATRDGSAISSSEVADYRALTTRPVVFEAGQTEVTVDVEVLEDRRTERPETFSLELSEPSGALLPDPTAKATIDDDDPVTLAVDRPSVAEGNKGTSPLEFTLSLSTPGGSVELDTHLAVDYETADRTATVDDADYLPTRGTVTFGAGSEGSPPGSTPPVTEKTVKVEVNGDRVPELDEKLVLRLTTTEPHVRMAEGGGGGAGAQTKDAEGTVRNDDPDDPYVWRTAAPPGHSRTGHAATPLGDGRVLVTGGTCSDNVPSEIYHPGEDRWTPAGTGMLRRFHTATVLAAGPGAGVLLAGGRSCRDPDAVQSTAELYDPATGTSRLTAPMGGGRSSHTAMLLNGKVLVAGGQDRTCEPRCFAERYDPGTGTWTPAGDMIAARQDHVAAAVPGGKVLVAGGRRGSNVVASAELFAESSPVPSVTGLSRASGPTAGGTEVVITGAGFEGVEQVQFGSEAATHKVESPNRIRAVAPPAPNAGEVDVTVETDAGMSASIRVARFTYVDPTGGWMPTADLQQRHGHTATRLDAPTCRAGVRHDWCGDVLVVGGADGNGRGAGAQLYDPTERAWRGAVSPSDVAQRGFGPQHTATLLDFEGCGSGGSPEDYPCGSVLVVGTRTHAGLGPAAARFDPRSGWTEEQCSSSGAPCPERGHSAVLLRDGRLLVAGGTSQGGAVLDATRAYEPAKSVWSKEPATSAWSIAPKMDTARTGHTATVLGDGSVLVVGGSSGDGLKLASVERYVPGTGGGPGSWVPAANMVTARSGHTATLLPDGSVLVVGGDGSGGKLASAERYVPGAGGGTWRATAPLARGRSGHTATLLVEPGCAGNCGQVLVAGGTGSDGTPLAGAELYEPSASSGPGRWSTTAGLDACSPSRSCRARTSHTATQLAGGDVLVVGGKVPATEPAGPAGDTAAPEEPLDPPAASGTAEIYHSATGQPTVQALLPSFGPTFGGTAVRILGTGFFSTPVVRFGDVPAAEVTRVSEAEVVAVSPSQGQGDVVVSVQTGSGISQPGPRFEYRGGLFTATDDLTGCEPHPSCAARFLHTATLLDPPACQGPNPPPGYPCGKVLIAGGTSEYGVVTGSPNDVRASTQLYDPATGQWAPTGSMTAPRYNHTATLLPDGKVLVVGGKMHPPTGTVGEAHASAELYDPVTGVWRPTGPLRDARYSHTATLLNPATCQSPNPPADYPCGSVLVTGGAMEEQRRVAMASAELYDPSRGAWTAVSPLDSCTPVTSACSARASHTATLLDDGRVVVTGGTGPASPHAGVATGRVPTEPASPAEPGTVTQHRGTVTELDPTRCPPGLRAPPAALEKVCPIPFLASSQVFDPSAGRWNASGSMGGVEGGSPRAFHTATKLPSGEVLVAGGQSTLKVSLSSAERYDPAATDPGTGRRGRWVPTGSMRRVRAGHTATLLPEGRVLVTGSGAPSVEGATAEMPDESAEIYDPASGRWIHPNPMKRARGVHTATFLTGPACRGDSPPRWCGTVLLAGGRDAPGELKSPAESVLGSLSAGLASFPPDSGPVRQDVENCVERRSVSTVCTSSAMASAEIFSPAPTVGGVAPRLATARGGTPVTVTGTGFNRSVTVLAGGAAAPAPRVMSTTQLSFLAPAHAAGPVGVEVVNGGGTSAFVVPDPLAGLLYVGAAGAIDNLVAHALSPTVVRLSFAGAPDGTTLDYAVNYEVVQSVADGPSVSLCERGVCRARREDTSTDKRPRSLQITDLTPGTTYSWTLRPHNALGEAGAETATVSLTTPGSRPEAKSAALNEGAVAGTCLPRVPGALGSVTYPGRHYVLLGLPEGTEVPSASPLYGWFDLGARGSYSVSPPGAVVAGGRGYWSWSPCERAVAPAGDGVAGLTLPLGRYRASMIGNPSGRAPVTVSGHDWIAQWEPAANAGAGAYRLSGYRQSQRLAVGEGAWVFSYGDTEIRLRE